MPKRVLQSLGLVFGDIGTSPIYTLTVIFLITTPTEIQTIGVLSLIIWTIILLVGVQYAWLAMSLGKKGEGGTIVLYEILSPMVKSKKKIRIISILSFIGVALFFGDGVITPAISILSAVEGLHLIPQISGIGNHTSALLIIAAVIAIVLFAFQKKGTEKISGAFGPIMVCWFLCLTVSGLASISKAPAILNAINPYHAFYFMSHNGIVAFIVLSEVILCATGGEALYADMGHLGRKPIINASYIVIPALIINYLGQGAFMFDHPKAKYVLFEMFYDQSHLLYVPFLILSIMATAVASQAMISGVFSIVYQAISTGVLPRLHVDYTSRHRQSQIYVGFINWVLLLAVLLIMFFFQQSSRIAAAYGLAVTGTMTITCIMMVWIFYLKNKKTHMIIAFIITLVNIVFLFSHIHKFPHGGYWSLVIAAFPLAIILVYDYGKKKLYKTFEFVPLSSFKKTFRKKYQEGANINGTALFFSRDVTIISPYIVRTMFNNNIIYEDNVIVSIENTTDPFGISWYFSESKTKGLRLLTLRAGYMEVVDVEAIFRKEGIVGNAIFYGLEEISSSNILIKIFALIKKLVPAFVQFHKLPAMKLHGVMTRYELYPDSQLPLSDNHGNQEPFRP